MIFPGAACGGTWSHGSQRRSFRSRAAGRGPRRKRDFLRSSRAREREASDRCLSRSGGSEAGVYVLTVREGVNLAQLLPNVSPLQRELDVVLLHEGILEPALGITPQAVTAEANLTYEREAEAALEAVDSGRAQIAFLLNACDVEQVD